MQDAYRVRAQARTEGRDTFIAVREYLEGLDTEALEAVLAEVESRKAKRPKKQAEKIKLITARICQGDAFLSRAVARQE